MPKEKREYDRRSGTGRDPTKNPKNGHGKANWGTYKDEMVEADPNSGRPGPERKERGKKITGTQYLEDYMKSIGHEVATKPVQTVAPRRKKTGKMSLAEFQAQGQVEA